MYKINARRDAILHVPVTQGPVSAQRQRRASGLGSPTRDQTTSAGATDKNQQCQRTIMRIQSALVPMMTFRLGFHEIMNDREYSRGAGKAAAAAAIRSWTPLTLGIGHESTRPFASPEVCSLRPARGSSRRRIAVGSKKVRISMLQDRKDRRCREGEVEGRIKNASTRRRGVFKGRLLNAVYYMDKDISQ